MRVERRSRRGLPTYDKNPFWQPYEVRIGKKFIRIAGGDYLNKETGEVISNAGIHIIEDKDEEEFIKIYSKNVKAFFDLKPTTLKVLMYVLNTLQEAPNAEAIYLNWFGLQQFAGNKDMQLSEASFHRAMKELLEKGFLAEAVEPHKYWINPHLFFNGDRMVFIKEYRKIQSHKLETP